MKAKQYVNGLSLGLLVGGGIVYYITTNPRKRRKVQRFIDNVEEKAKSFGDRVKEKLGYGEHGDFQNEISDDELMAIEATIISETIIEAEEEAAKKNTAHQSKESHKEKGPKPAPASSGSDANMGPGVC